MSARTGDFGLREGGGGGGVSGRACRTDVPGDEAVAAAMNARRARGGRCATRGAVCPPRAGDGGPMGPTTRKKGPQVGSAAQVRHQADRKLRALRLLAQAAANVVL